MNRALSLRQPGPYLGINPHHMLSKGLIHLTLANQFSYGRPIDKVGKAQWTTIVPTWGIRPKGPAFRSASASNASTTALNFLGAPFSVAAFFNIEVFTTANQARIWGRSAYTSESVNTGWALSGNSGGSFAFSTYNNSSNAVYLLLGNIARANGDWMLVGTVSPTTKSLYINGGLNVSNSVGLTIASTAGHLSLTSVTELIWLYAGYAWNRALTAQEVRELYLNPYCMLLDPSISRHGAAAAAAVLGPHLNSMLLAGVGR